MKKILLRSVVLLGLVFATASCSKKEPEPEPACQHPADQCVFVAEVESTCHTHGRNAYYTCKVCKAILSTDRKVLPAIPEATNPLDPNNHEGTEELAIKAGYKANYIIDEEFDMENTTFIKKCNLCEGTELTTTQKGGITVTYPTDKATKFTSEDAKKASVEVAFKYGNLPVAKATVTVGKKDNVITGATDIEEHCGYSVKTIVERTTVAATSGLALTYSFATTKDGTYTPYGTAPYTEADVLDCKESLISKEATEYFVKVTDAGGDTFKEATAEFVVSIAHNVTDWDKSGEEFDTYGCKCQDESEVYKFDKLGDKQDIVLSNTTQTLSLANTSYIAASDVITSVEILKKGETPEKINLGTSLELTMADVAATGIFGDTEMYVTVNSVEVTDKAPATSHIIKIPVCVVTAIIMNNETSLRQIMPHLSGVGEGDVKQVDGYFKLGENITNAQIAKVRAGDTKPGNYSGAADQYAFIGTLDGDGHVLQTQSCVYGGIFCGLLNATIKNVEIQDAWYRNTNNYSLICNSMQGTTMENVTIKATANTGIANCNPTKDAYSYGWISRTRSMSNTFINVDFNANGANVSRLLNTQNGNDSTFTNCTFECGSYYSLGKHWQNGDYFTKEGLTITGTLLPLA